MKTKLIIFTILYTVIILRFVMFNYLIDHFKLRRLSKKCTAVTQGKITSNKMRIRHHKDSNGEINTNLDEYYYRSSYEYTVDGVTYNLKAKFDTKSNREIGPIEVRYNPDKPKESLLPYEENGIGANNIIGGIIAGIFFLFIPLIILFQIITSM